ncbi:Ubiquitin-conjugating enzyme E2 J1 [Mactra antiquata]
MQGMYSMRSPAVKRLMKEAQELSEPTEQYECHPLEDNLFEWHFTIRGPVDTEFDGGLYHGRIILPPEYPMKPPSIIILTPNGRFEINKKICLSISGHHPESWQPSWSLRTALLAIIGFMPTHGAGALGSLDYTPEERKILAKRSQDFNCPSCGKLDNVLKPVTEESKKTTEEARELAAQIDFKDEKEKNAALKSSPPSTETTQTENSTSTQSPVSEASTSIPPQAGAPMFSPPPFGQFPFRLPFPPPFPSMSPPGNDSGGNPAAQVPRFPLPFVAPFMPPPMMFPGGFPMPPPMMQGMPPWQQGTPIPPASPPRDTTYTGSNNTPSQNSPSTRQQNDDTQTTNENTSQTNADDETTSPSTTTSTSAATTTSTGNADTSTSNETSSTSSNQEGVRHRNVTTTESVQQSRTNVNVNQPAEIRDNRYQTQPGDRLLICFAVFVVTVILLLVIRRLHMMKWLTLF